MFRRNAWSLAAGIGASSLTFSLAGCLGTGTQRIDAPCREMRSAVVYEMLKDNPSIPVLDVRRKSEITQEARLSHAIAVPIDRLSGRVPELERFRDTTVVVVGADGDSGRHACQLLSARGFKYVIFVSDGAAGWFASGVPSTTPSSAAAPTATPTATPAARMSE